MHPGMVRRASEADQHSSIDSLTLSILQIAFRRASAAGIDLARSIARYQLPCKADDILNGAIPALQRAHLIPLYKEAMLAITDAASKRENVISPNYDESAMIFYASIGCQNLEKAISRSIAFVDMLHVSNIKMYLKISGKDAEFGYTTPRKIRSIDNFLLDLLGLHYFYQFFSWAIGEALPLTSVSLCQDNLLPDHDVSEMFDQAIGFNAASNGITFPAAYLKCSIIRSYSDLETMLATFPFEMMPRQLISDNLTDRVKAMFRITLRNEGRMATFDEVAQKLNIGAATLRRRLARDNVSIRSLKADCRRDAAISLLRLTNLSIEEVAFRVGFSAPNAFRRAVYAWTGASPSTFRRKEGKSDLSTGFAGRPPASPSRIA